jgi:putative SOS response-associated peptidase YedK
VYPVEEKRTFYSINARLSLRFLGTHRKLGRAIPHPEAHDTILDLIRWGLLPFWAKDQKIAWKLINARAETVATAPAFKKAFAKRRRLVPVDGFYEWKKVGKEKRPYLIGMANGEPFTLAGLWENWKDPASGEWIRTFTIITTDANDLVCELHDRMPVVIGARLDAGKLAQERRPQPAGAGR